jgi:protein ImuA
MSGTSIDRKPGTPLVAPHHAGQYPERQECILEQTLLAALRAGTFHEIYAACESDSVATMGFALAAIGLCRRDAGSGTAPLLWIRQGMAKCEGGGVYPPGLSAFGVRPENIIALSVHDIRSALQAGLDGARSRSLDVLIEMRGESRIYDITASRRLALAATASGVRVILQRSAAVPMASAARTRWSIRAAPSIPTEIKAPGEPAFDVTLLHHRNGQSGFQAIVEWNNETRSFVQRTAVSQLQDGVIVAKSRHSRNIPPVSGTVVPFLGHGSHPDEGRETFFSSVR